MDGLPAGCEWGRKGRKHASAMTLTRISSFLKRCMWTKNLYVGHTTGSTLCCHSSLSAVRLSITHTSREWEPHNVVFVRSCLHMCLSPEYSFMFECSEQRRYSLAMHATDGWYCWPGVNGGRSASLQISKGAWEGLCVFIIWQDWVKDCKWQNYIQQKVLIWFSVWLRS